MWTALSVSSKVILKQDKAYQQLAPSFIDATTNNKVTGQLRRERKAVRIARHLRTQGQDIGGFFVQNILTEINDDNYRQGMPTSRFWNSRNIGNSTQRGKQRCSNCVVFDQLTLKHEKVKAAYERLQLENVRLQKENEQLSRAFRQLQIKGGTPENISLTIKYRSQALRLQELLRQKCEAQQKQMQMLNNVILKSEFLQKELETKEDSITYANQQLSKYSIRSSSDKAELRRTEEIALMGLEDMLSQRTELFHLRRMMRKMKDQKVRQNQQLRRIEMENGATYKVRKSNFDYQLQIFSTLTNSLASVRQGLTSLNGPKNNQESRQPYSKFLDASCSLNNQEAVYKFIEQDQRLELDLTIFNLGRPTFFSFIAHEYELLGYDHNSYYRAHTPAKLNEKRSRVMSLIRSIFDSMHRNFQLENVMGVRAFPEFVYSWFECFNVHDKTKCIITEPKDAASASKHRFEFYAALMNEAFNDNWEAVAFRQFLLETSSLEELYAYLRMRHFLFRGDSVARMQAHYDYIMQVQLCQIDPLLSYFLPCDKVNISYLKNLLKGSSVLIKGRKFIDSGFLLRSCLEYFRARRVETFNSLAKKFQADGPAQKNETTIRNYPQFAMFVAANFKSLNSTERAGVFRRCIAYSDGNITAQILFAALTEERVFLKQLIEEMDGRWLKAIAVPPSRLLVSTCSSLTKLIYGNSFFKKFVARLGVESLAKMISAGPDCNSPYELFKHVEKLGKLMHYCFGELMLNPRIEYESIEPCFPSFAEHLSKLYKGTISRIEYMESKQQAVARQLVRSIERVVVLRIEDYNLNVISKMAETTQSLTTRRGSFRRQVHKVRDSVLPN